MPRIEVSHLLQKAVLWPFEGVDEFNKPVRGSPVEIRVRWEYRKVQNEQDEATVAEVVVDREIETRSLLWLGELADFFGTGSGAADVEVKEVQQYREVPDIKNRVSYRTVLLRRFQGDLPEVERVGTASNVDLMVLGTGFGFTEITTGTGTGTDDVACSTCPRLNDDFECLLIDNSVSTQEWRSEAVEICNEQWHWEINRDLAANTITVELIAADLEVHVTYSVSGQTWDGEDLLTLTRVSGSNLCEWPATLQIRGA